MQFLYPTFLYAAAAVAIPILIHLFHFRRFRKVYFTNVRFLREVKEETSARQRLRNLLVLLMRCLAIVMLAFAFAQPYIPADGTHAEGDSAVSIYVDNSFSMRAMSEDAPLLERARQRAREIVSAYSVEDRFQVLTNDMEGRHLRLVSKEEALGFIEEIDISPAVRTCSEVLRQQEQVLGTATTANRVAYLISDFQAVSTDLENYRDTALTIRLVPLQAVRENNVSIDSAWFDAPVQLADQASRLLVRLRNWSREPAENVRLSVRYDGETKPVSELSLPAAGERVDTVVFSLRRTGWHEAAVQVTDYPVQFDDEYYFAFEVVDTIRVLAIHAEGVDPYLDAAFSRNPLFRIRHVEARNIDYAGFSDYSLIICQGLPTLSTGLAAELLRFLEEGGNVLIFPGAGAGRDGYNDFFRRVPAPELGAFEQEERIVSEINTDAFVFKDVYINRSLPLTLPLTHGNYRLVPGSVAGEPLLTYRDGQVFLGACNRGKGVLYQCAAPLSETYGNLARSGEVFIPMLNKMALSNVRNRPIAYVIGREEVVETAVPARGAEQVYRLAGKDGDFIPRQRSIGSRLVLGMERNVGQAGYYDLKGGADTVWAKFAFNHDRRESDLRCLAGEELEEQVSDNVSVLSALAAADFQELVSDRNRGTVLWKICLLLALLALAAETVLLRVWRT
ncbi:MAG: hypothetical protein RLY31_2908 [Bacteroidota bacterium]